MLSYYTFVGRRRSWQLYRGVGIGKIVERRDGDPIVDVSGADRPILWLASLRADGGGGLHRVSLPGLDAEGIPWTGGRIGAVASAPDGERAAVLELPDGLDEMPRLLVWRRDGWSSVTTSERPDISSALAWISADRVAYESASRRLSVADVGTGSADSVGPPGSSPTPVWRHAEWRAISDGSVVAFPSERPFEFPPRQVDGFSFRQPSRVRCSSDGEVCAWTEPWLVKQVRGYVQVRKERRRRLRELEDGLGAVVGPYESENE
jgi:hypothetical protein